MPIQSHTDGPQQPFLGAWTLISAEQVLPSGETLFPFGEHPSGMLLYQAGGFVSAQVSVGNPRRLADDDYLKAPTEEAAAAWRNYLGYWGSFQIDSERHIITHRVQGCSFANWIGSEQVRHFHFDPSGRLILQADFEEGRYTLTWQRNSA